MQTTQTKIEHAEIVAGHDGLPELVVTLRYSNGATGTATLENVTGVKLLEQCGVRTVAELAGQPWTQLLRAVGVAG